METDVNRLLDRPYPQGYENEWLIAAKEPQQEKLHLKILVFRIDADWFGLDTKAVGFVGLKKFVHSIPFLSDPLRGVVNINGDLKPVFSLTALMENKLAKETDREFMILILQDHDSWVFTVDEILGIFAISPRDLQNVPVNVSKSYGNLIKGLIDVETKTVAVLEEELLFYSLSQ